MIETGLAHHSPATLVAWSVAIAGAGIAAAWDARTRRIPNVLTLPLLGLGLIFSGISGWGEGIQSALLGCLVLGVPYVLLFIFAGGGAGDAKMMAAIGAWVGFSGSIPVLVLVSISGGIFAIGYSIMRRRLGAVTVNLRAMAFGAGLLAFHRVGLSDAQGAIPEQKKMLAMPYGLAIFAGTITAAVWVLLWH